MGLLGLTLGVAVIVGVAVADGSGVLVAVAVADGSGVLVTVGDGVEVGVADPKAVDAVAVKLNMACGDDCALHKLPYACTRTM